MDEMVLSVQQWLNTTYGSNSSYKKYYPNGISENGITGTQVEKALIIALQIEEGISSPNGTFGPATASNFASLSCRTESQITNPPTNMEYILQGGFWCKGYNSGGFTGIFYTSTKAAVMSFQADAGLTNQDGIVTSLIMKALLNTDPFVLSSRGDSRIRQIQQDLNNRYHAYTGLLATNGVYVAATNKALIYALQAEEGLSVSTANGRFGPSTTTRCPTLSPNDSRTNYVKLLQYALYCNNFDPGAFNGIYSDEVTSAVSSYQSFMCLPVTGIANMPTIKAAMVSTGDTERSALACDCATILTAAKASTLFTNGYRYVGRYLTGTVGIGISKALTAKELQIIFNAGLKVFPIYESHGTTNSYFTSSQGSYDACAAITAAENLGIPANTIIYFAVDYDALDSQVRSHVLPYFNSIKTYFNNYNSQKYRVGVYGDRNVASSVCNSNYAVSSFVADMSTGYSGNIGYTMPSNWAFDQFYTVTLGSGEGKIEIDKDAYSGRDTGVDHVTLSANTPCVFNNPPIQPATTNKQDPINTGLGAHTINMTAIKVHGALDLHFDMSYNSAMLAVGTMGKGWFHNYELKITAVYNSYYVFWSPSNFSVFTAGSDGNYTCSDLGKQNYILTVNSDGTFTLNINNDIIYSFSSAGTLTNVKNRMGMTISVSTDDSGNQVITEPISGQTLAITYNSSGLVNSVVDKSGRSVNFAYNSDFCLSSMTDSDGKTTVYTYDSAGHILTGTDSDGICFFTDTYDDSGRIATQKDAIAGSEASTFNYDTTTVSGKIIVTVHDRNGNISKNIFNSTTRQLISSIDENGNTTTYSYDLNGNINHVTDPLNNTISTTYNSLNLPISITDRSGAVTTYTYDSVGNKTKETRPDGGEINYTYDSSNRILSITDLRNTVTTFTYNSNGLLTEKNYGTEKTSYSYENGLLKILTDPNGNSSTCVYDSVGRLLSRTDGCGNTTSYTYDGKDNILTEVNPLQNTVSYTYNSRGKVLSKTNANGHTTTYQYNGNGKQISETDPKGNSVTYFYDGEDRLIKSVNAQGKMTTSTYDPAGRELTKTDAHGKTTTSTYDATGNILTVTKPNGGVFAKTYYANGKIKTSKDAAGNTTTFGYDSGWRLNSTTNAIGKTSNNLFNNAGDLLSTTNYFGESTVFTYDSYGNKLTETDARGNVTTYTYDSNNNKKSRTDALGNVTTYTYDALNRLIMTTDANGHSVATTYDAAGRIILQTDALGNSSSTTYDAQGNIIGKTDALGNVINVTEYDNANLPTVVKDALNNTTTNTYNSLNQLIQVKDPLNNSVNFGYDNVGRVISSTNALLGVNAATFDGNGNKTSETNPLGGTTTYTFDSCDRKTSETTVSEGTISYSYNALGLIASEINARGQVKSFNYDDNGRISSFTNSEGTTSFTYDANGNVLTSTNAQGTITRQFDALNRITQLTDVFGNVVRYTYDNVGNLSSLIYPDNKIVTYTYDANNRISSVTDWANRVTQYFYDANGRLIRTVRADGSILIKSFNALGQLVSAVDKDSSENIISSYNYVYDANGNILSENSNSAGVDNAVMSYDALNRLSSKIDKDSSDTTLASYSYNYDANGNILSGSSSAQTSSMTYDNHDRISTYNNQNVAFDLDGNMTSCTLKGNTTSLVYNSDNKLISVGDTVYAYDADGNRISVTKNAQKTKYTYDNAGTMLNRLLVSTAPNGSKTFYVYGNGIIAQENSNGYSVYHFDCRGSTIALTNLQGTVTDRFSYGAYGELLTHTGSVNTPFMYNGRDSVISDENSLYFMRTRYYSPELKRFVNADTKKGSIEQVQSLNLYSFVLGNPILLIDPAGTSAELSNDDPMIGQTNTVYEMEVVSSVSENTLYTSMKNETSVGFKTTVGKEGYLLTTDKFSNGGTYGSTYESSGKSITITNNSISFGTTVDLLPLDGDKQTQTTSSGFNFETGSITYEVETVTDKGSIKHVTSNQISYNINIPKIAEAAVEGVSNKLTSSAQQFSDNFQKATNAFSQGDMDSAGYYMLQVTIYGGMILALLLLGFALSPVK